MPFASRHRGRYGRVLPKRLRAAYLASLNDDVGLVDTRNEIALYDTRLHALVSKLEQTDCPEFRETALALFFDAEKTVEKNEQIEKLGEWLKKGNRESAVWREILGISKERARLSDSRAKVILQGEQAIAARDFNFLVGKLMDIVLDESPADRARKIINRLQEEVMGGSEEKMPPTRLPLEPQKSEWGEANIEGREYREPDYWERGLIEKKKKASDDG